MFATEGLALLDKRKIQGHTPIPSLYIDSHLESFTIQRTLNLLMSRRQNLIKTIEEN